MDRSGTADAMELEVALWNIELVPGNVISEVTARGNNGFGSSGR